MRGLICSGCGRAAGRSAEEKAEWNAKAAEGRVRQQDQRERQQLLVVRGPVFPGVYEPFMVPWDDFYAETCVKVVGGKRMRTGWRFLRTVEAGADGVPWLERGKCFACGWECRFARNGELLPRSHEDWPSVTLGCECKYPVYHRSAEFTWHGGPGKRSSWEWCSPRSLGFWWDHKGRRLEGDGSLPLCLPRLRGTGRSPEEVKEWELFVWTDRADVKVERRDFQFATERGLGEDEVLLPLEKGEWDARVWRPMEQHARMFGPSPGLSDEWPRWHAWAGFFREFTPRVLDAVPRVEWLYEDGSKWQRVKHDGPGGFTGWEVPDADVWERVDAGRRGAARREGVEEEMWVPWTGSSVTGVPPGSLEGLVESVSIPDKMVVEFGHGVRPEYEVLGGTYLLADGVECNGCVVYACGGNRIFRDGERRSERESGEAGGRRALRCRGRQIHGCASNSALRVRGRRSRLRGTRTARLGCALA